MWRCSKGDPRPASRPDDITTYLKLPSSYAARALCSISTACQPHLSRMSTASQPRIKRISAECQHHASRQSVQLHSLVTDVLCVFVCVCVCVCVGVCVCGCVWACVCVGVCGGLRIESRIALWCGEARKADHRFKISLAGAGLCVPSSVVTENEPL